MPGRTLRRPALPFVCGLVAVGSVLVAGAPAAVATGTIAHKFAAPSGIAADGKWLVVTNRANSTLSVLSASSGAVAATVSHRTLVVSAPSAIVASTTSGRSLVFVAGAGSDVAELNVATKGTRPVVTELRVLRPKGCARTSTAALAVDTHGHVLEACSSGVVTEWAVRMGGLVRSFPATTTKLTDATGITVLGTNAYVTNAATSQKGSAPDSVTELSLATGRRVGSVSDATNPGYLFSAPRGISNDGTNLWEINANGNSVDELASNLTFLTNSYTNLSEPGIVLATPAAVFVSSSGAYPMVTQFTGTGATLTSPWMMCNTNGPYKFDATTGFAISGTSLWVTNSGNGLIDEMSASTGALIKTIG